MKFQAIALLLLVSFAAQAQAQTRYVEDRLEITMRNGQSTKNAIIRMLKSGTPVEVLETNKETGYTRVVVGRSEGWVLSRFLMNEPSGRQQLENSQQRLQRLRNQFENSSAGVTTLEQENADLRGQKTELESTTKRLTRELNDIQAKAANILAIDRENKRLKSDLGKIQSQLDSVSDENKSLRDRTAQNWFILGAAVLLAGFLLGFILPRIRFKKKSSWGSL